MKIRYLPNNVEKELSNRVKIDGNGNSKECQRIIRINGSGEEKIIWNNVVVIPLGLATTFDVRQFYEDYRNLTVDNFYFNQLNFTIGDYAYAGYSTSVSSSMSKSYNADTGQLIFKYNSTPVNAYLIPEVNTLLAKGIMQNLGTGTSFDCTSIQGYQSLTADNFFYKTLPSTSDSISCYSGSCWCRITFSKSYNQNGTLSTELSRQRHSDVSVNPFYLPTRYL